jgi:hypothetical protein
MRRLLCTQSDTSKAISQRTWFALNGLIDFAPTKQAAEPPQSMRMPLRRMSAAARYTARTVHRYVSTSGRVCAIPAWKRHRWCKSTSVMVWSICSRCNRLGMIMRYLPNGCNIDDIFECECSALASSARVRLAGYERRSVAYRYYTSGFESVPVGHDWLWSLSVANDGTMRMDTLAHGGSRSQSIARLQDGECCRVGRYRYAK